MQGVQVRSLVRGAGIPHASQPKNQNRSNIVTSSVKTLKIVHIKKNLKKKKRNRRLFHIAKIILLFF